MKKYVIIIASALLLLACNENRNRRVQQIMREAEERAEGGCRMSEDSSSERVATEVIQDTIIVGDFPDSPRRPASSSVRPHRRVNDDNMRGFDPPSEDDMDDNGMSRYMENNDEEGWE